MKLLYGAADWQHFDQGEKTGFLLTNGLGGFSALTMMGSLARGDQGLLIAALRSPNLRMNLVHRLREELEVGGIRQVISSQEFADGSREEGFRSLISFEFEDTPIWHFLYRGVEIKKELALKQGENTLALRYEIHNAGSRPCRLILTPFLRFAPKGRDPEPDQPIDCTKNCMSSAGCSLFFYCRGAQAEAIAREEERYAYSLDRRDGRDPCGRAFAVQRFSALCEAQKSTVVEIVFSLRETEISAEALIAEEKQFRRTLAERAGFCSSAARLLSKSAAQFISARDSTGGSTILAGFPFFEDWGRDTMIALPGLCLTVGRFDTARSILKTFAAYEYRGLMPNLFPEGESEPLYNTADAALLFINCVYLYFRSSGDSAFIEEVYPVMTRIIEGYKAGTDFGIGMDGDGLICAGEGLSQVSWMDVRIGDFLPTPRHGKPVEINAYWYNALCIMDFFSRLLGEDKGDFATLSKGVKASFKSLFWMEDRGFLRDVISSAALRSERLRAGLPLPDEQMRCNQIWAVSLPFTMLERRCERLIVDRVYEELFTPLGLRTLSASDPEFRGLYGGSMRERDLAYHQGTVWPFTLGAYYLAYLKVHDYSGKARSWVLSMLDCIEAALREGCAGQIAEIYDGACPAASRGCYAQAWSVGEILRAYRAAECGSAEDGQGVVLRPES